MTYGNRKSLLGWLVALAVLATASQASAYTLKPIYDFCAQQKCADGAEPLGPLLMDQSGNLFGTSTFGGTGYGYYGTGGGAVFELSPRPGGGWRERVLHSFCVETDCTDGSIVNGQLIADAAGNLYGTTRSDSYSCDQFNRCGLVFELMPNAKRTKWKFKIVYRFCNKASPCRDGSVPLAGLTYAGAASGASYDGVSPLYVATSGTILELIPGNPRWRASIIADKFCHKPLGCNAAPTSNLFVDASGDIYGADQFSMWEGVGAIFELSPGAGKRWTETTLHSFCVPQGQNCQTGGIPYAPSLLGSDKSFFGVTAEGGKWASPPDDTCQDFNPTGGCGVLYKLVPGGDRAKEVVLYDFCSETYCADGAFPDPHLSIDSSGNLFGTTSDGGPQKGGCGEYSLCPGVVFRFGKDGYQLLYGFCSEANCTDGKEPLGGVIVDAAGNLFGAASGGGKYGQGRIYELVP